VAAIAMDVQPKPPTSARCEAEMDLLPDVSSIASVWYYRCGRCGELAAVEKKTITRLDDWLSSRRSQSSEPNRR
jgi:hypothetical protein